MPDDTHSPDELIIHAAYADRVKEAFRVFAESLGMGENEKNLRERFARQMELTRKARDLALLAVNGTGIVEPAGADRLADRAPAEAALPADLQAIVDSATSNTTGQRAPPPTQRSALDQYRR